MPSEEFESELDVGEEEEEVPKPSSLRSVLRWAKVAQKAGPGWSSRDTMSWTPCKTNESKSGDIYKSKASANSQWWEGKSDEDSDEDDDEDFNANFELDEEEEKEKLAEQERKMEAAGVKGKVTLEQLLEKGSTPAVKITHDQEKFVITQKDQLEFDADWKANGTYDGSFVGHKACVPGCFTGDNIIVEERWEGGYKKGNEVTGIRNRVRAGVQHYEYDLYATLAAPEDRNKVVIYTTTLGVDKKIVADCTRAVNIIRPMNVQWEERDIFNFEEHKECYLKLYHAITEFLLLQGQT